MISVILYGRNDSYGYNLHKRAAISFNCIAEVLDDADDEIIFVDYNTPDDFPTFPEAIQDTLTANARERLRILRIRPHIHDRFKDRTHLKALEPISRNVAVRRSNPRNRWILSTNTDMIFVPRQQRSLSAIARDLPPGYYGAPRLELPETLWESLDRRDGRQIINTVKRWGRDLHLDEIVYGEPAILFDAPGDFQLIQRADLFAIDAFDESMLLGWHVDANILRRLSLVHGPVADLKDEVFGYHCDHTRQITPAHRHDRLSNDLTRYFYQLRDPYVPEQRDHWGCVDENIEEISLVVPSSANYVTALQHVMGEAKTSPYVTLMHNQYNKMSYDAKHVLPFLLDNFSSAVRSTKIGWFGLGPEMLDLFARCWIELGFTGAILVSEPATEIGEGPSRAGISIVPREVLLEAADALVFDIGASMDTVRERTPPHLLSRFAAAFDAAVTMERDRIAAGLAPRRFIAVNAVYNSFEVVFGSCVAAGETPFSTRIRHGFVLPKETNVNWLPLMKPIGSSVWDGKEIILSDGQSGYLMSGPYRYLVSGDYQLECVVHAEGDGLRPGGFDVVYEMAAGQHVFGQMGLKLSPGRNEHLLIVRVPSAAAGGLELFSFRLRTLMPMRVRLVKLLLSRLETPASGTTHIERGFVRDHGDLDWLLGLETVGSGFRCGEAICSTDESAGYFVDGPHEPLSPGDYEMRIAVAFGGSNPRPGGFDLRCEIAAGLLLLGSTGLKLSSERNEYVLFVRIPPEGQGELQLYTLRLRTLAPMKVKLTQLHLARLATPVPHTAYIERGFVSSFMDQDWLAGMEAVGVGRWDGTHICSADDGAGYFADGPHEPLPPGDYEIRAILSLDGSVSGASGFDVMCELAAGALNLGVVGLKLLPQPAEILLPIRIPPLAGGLQLFKLRFRTLTPARVRLAQLRISRLSEQVPATSHIDRGFVRVYDNLD